MATASSAPPISVAGVLTCTEEGASSLGSWPPARAADGAGVGSLAPLLGSEWDATFTVGDSSALSACGLSSCLDDLVFDSAVFFASTLAALSVFGLLATTAYRSSDAG